jgi:23S rRNA (cytidine1920-2'-O)/16S rRNA (cytidine1409-2'-O)-methyltransferase
MKNESERLDKLLHERGLVPSRERAKSLIMAGLVVVNDHMVSKAGEKVPLYADIRIKADLHPYVSRGGVKLEKALVHFGIEVNGVVAIDVGASTGGFTDCLLQRGARKVYAVDVGYGQLAWKLRQDERVESIEKTNIRYMPAERLTDKPRLAVIDASFISLDKILPHVIILLEDAGEIVALIKPQFEVGKGEVGKGGVVREERKHSEVINKITMTSGTLGLEVLGITDSPILGSKGNREFLIHLIKRSVL